MCEWHLQIKKSFIFIVLERLTDTSRDIQAHFYLKNLLEQLGWVSLILYHFHIYFHGASIASMSNDHYHFMMDDILDCLDRGKWIENYPTIGNLKGLPNKILLAVIFICYLCTIAYLHSNFELFYLRCYISEEKSAMITPLSRKIERFILLPLRLCKALEG